MSEKFSREQFAAKLGANGDPKLTAAADFAARLLNGPMGEHIERIMLFGSVATGDARPESDIDVMVFGDAPTAKFAEAVDDAALQSLLELGQDVEPMKYDINAMRHPPCYVVYSTLKRGREVFAKSVAPDLSFINEEQMRNQEAHDLCRKAQQHLTEAEGTLAMGYYALS